MKTVPAHLVGPDTPVSLSLIKGNETPDLSFNRCDSHSLSKMNE